ncbi:hypothetical protein J4730_22135 [Klebsiella pneumoniae]|uniref:Tail length tape measure domain-containing protein n=1 Tax=Klebsiella pneumoniae TaxID=573 RepID=A0A939NJZ6_KLEPN|nr:hypothetical protein [Klebsiella pneumoniae]
MINHLTSVETVTRSLEEATSALAVEQERLTQMQAKSESIQSVLEGIENRRIALIRQQAAEQNSAYQSLLMMNGEHTEFNRLLGLEIISSWPGRAGKRTTTLTTGRPDNPANGCTGKSRRDWRFQNSKERTKNAHDWVTLRMTRVN